MLPSRGIYDFLMSFNLLYALLYPTIFHVGLLVVVVTLLLRYSDRKRTKEKGKDKRLGDGLKPEHSKKSQETSRKEGTYYDAESTVLPQHDAGRESKDS